MRYDFTSPGGNVASSLLDLMVRQKAEERQAMLDSLHQRDVESQMQDRATNRKIQEENVAISQQARAQAEQAAKISGGLRVAEATPAGTELTPESEAALKDANLGQLIKQGVPTGGAMDASIGEGPVMQTHNTFTGTAKQSHEAEVLAQKQALAEVQAELKRAHDEAMAFAAEGRNKEAQQRLDMAQQRLESMMQIQGLNAQLTQTKIDAAHDKEKSAADAKKAAEGQRGEVARLAQEVMNDPNLSHVLGPLAGVTPSMREGSIALDSKIKRLNSMLSLEGRSALKGSGAISDFEAKMLEAAASTLGNQRVDPGTYVTELKRVSGLGGYAPGAKDEIPGAPPTVPPAGGAVTWERGPDGRPRPVTTR